MEFFREPGCISETFAHFLKWDGIRGLDSDILRQPFSSGPALGARLGSIPMDKDRMAAGLLWPFPLQGSGRVGITHQGWKSRPDGDAWGLFLQPIWQGSRAWCTTGAPGGQGQGHQRPQESPRHRWKAGSPLRRGGRPEAGCSLGAQGAVPGARRRHSSGASDPGRSHSPGG